MIRRLVLEHWERGSVSRVRWVDDGFCLDGLSVETSPLLLLPLQEILPCGRPLDH